jgi:hypothetical protein
MGGCILHIPAHPDGESGAIRMCRVDLTIHIFFPKAVDLKKLKLFLESVLAKGQGLLLKDI